MTKTRKVRATGGPRDQEGIEWPQLYHWNFSGQFGEWPGGIAAQVGHSWSKGIECK